MVLQDKIKKKSKEYGQLSAVSIKAAEYVLNNQWISVKDDLPCNYPNNVHCGFTDRVLATDGKINIFIALMKNINNKWVWYSDDNFDVQHVVTHWMPLPQPPKEYFEIR